MFNRLLIIGCGLLGSSILRAASSKKLSKKIFIYEKSNKNISEVKKLKIPCQILKNLNKNISDIDFDFGFIYAYSEQFRIGIHFQRPFIAFYYKF